MEGLSTGFIAGFLSGIIISGIIAWFYVMARAEEAAALREGLQVKSFEEGVTGCRLNPF